jgi:hexokinase
MAVDLGGTNFRVCSVKLNGDGTFNITSDKVAVPKALMVAKTAQELFAFLALQVKKFLEKHHGDHFEQHIRRRMTVSSPDGFRDENAFRMGFTFSFPVQQVGINKGTLIRWTKGFDIPDAVGKDVCALLQDEIDKLHLPVKVAALVNDTVGTLMAHSYGAPGEHGSVLGAIFGTGTNGAYVEKLSKLKKPLVGEYDTSTGEMVINTEWGSFDNQLNVLPNTPWDISLDKDSVNPGLQMYEKRVSGMFLGEILRLAIADLMKNPEVSFLKDENSSTNDRRSTTDIAVTSGLYKQWGVDTSIMSHAAGDHTPKLSVLRESMQDVLQISAPAHEDAKAFKAIADAIGRRAARLAAVAIGAIVLQTGRLTDPERKDEPVDVGVDGSLVENYPYFDNMMYEALRVIDGIGEEGAKRIRIGLAQDGSGVGAALIALVAAGMEKNASNADYIGELRTTAKTATTSENSEKPTAD